MRLWWGRMRSGRRRNGLPGRGGADRGQPRPVYGGAQPGHDDPYCHYRGGLRSADANSAEAVFQRSGQETGRQQFPCRPLSQGWATGAHVWWNAGQKASVIFCPGYMALLSVSDGSEVVWTVTSVKKAGVKIPFTPAFCRCDRP